MMADVVRVRRLRILGLVTVAALAFALAFVATHVSRTDAGSGTPIPAQQLEQPAGSDVPAELSAVAGIPVLKVKPAPKPAAAPTPTTTPTVTAASPPAPAPASSAPPPAATPAPAPVQSPASAPTPRPTSSLGTSFDDSG